VRKDVPGVVVGHGHRQPVYPCPVLDIIEDRTDAFVVKVGSEGEHRRLHQGNRLSIRGLAIKAIRVTMSGRPGL
jgi:hypothetical protein